MRRHRVNIASSPSAADIRWIQIHRHLEWDEQHQRPVRFYGAAEDITEQQQAEEAVVRSEQNAQNFQAQLRTLHELSIALEETESLDELCRMAVDLGRSRLEFDRLGIWLYEQDNTIARATFGTDEQGRTIDERGISVRTADYGRSSSADESFGLIDALVSGKQQLILHEAVVLPQPDGTVLGRGWSAQAAMWDGKRPVGHISADNLIYQRPVAPYQMELLSLYGITLGHIYSRKLAVQALRESEEKFRTIFELAPYIVTVQQQDGKFLEANPAFLEIVGLTAQQVLGKTLSELGLFDLETIRSAVRELETVGRVINSEQSVRLPDGQLRSMLISSARIQLGGEMLALTVAVDITERKRAEDALVQERTLLRTVIDHIPDNIYVKDREGKFILNNAQSLRILNASRQEDVLGKDDFDFLPPDLAARWWKEQSEIMDSGKALVDVEQFQSWLQDERRWIIESAIPLWNDHGAVIGLVGINRDISASKGIEEALRRSEAFQRALLDAISDPAFLMALDGTLLTLNKTLAESRGGTVEALIGTNAFEGLPAELSEERHKRFQLAAQTGKPVRWEDVNTLNFWDNSIYPILSQSGSVEAFAVYSREVTEQRRLAAELQRYNMQLEQIVEERTNQLRRTKEQIEIILNNIGDAVALAQPNGDIETSNPAFAEMFGESGH